MSTTHEPEPPFVLISTPEIVQASGTYRWMLGASDATTASVPPFTQVPPRTIFGTVAPSTTAWAPSLSRRRPIAWSPNWCCTVDRWRRKPTQNAGSLVMSRVSIDRNCSMQCCRMGTLARKRA
jgi:hypothetical protein